MLVCCLRHVRRTLRSLHPGSGSSQWEPSAQLEVLRWLEDTLRCAIYDLAPTTDPSAIWVRGECEALYVASFPLFFPTRALKMAAFDQALTAVDAVACAKQGGVSATQAEGDQHWLQVLSTAIAKADTVQHVLGTVGSHPEGVEAPQLPLEVPAVPEALQRGVGPSVEPSVGPSEDPREEEEVVALLPPAPEVAAGEKEGAEEEAGAPCEEEPAAAVGLDAAVWDGPRSIVMRVQWGEWTGHRQWLLHLEGGTEHPLEEGEEPDETPPGEVWMRTGEDTVCFGEGAGGGLCEESWGGG